MLTEETSIRHVNTLFPVGIESESRSTLAPSIKSEQKSVRRYDGRKTWFSEGFMAGFLLYFRLLSLPEHNMATLAEGILAGRRNLSMRNVAGTHGLRSSTQERIELALGNGWVRRYLRCGHFQR